MPHVPTNIHQFFLHFHGPVTILVSSRAAALSDVITSRDINEMADSPAGEVPLALHAKAAAEAGAAMTAPPSKPAETTMSYASVGQDGSVKFDDVEKKKKKPA